MWLNLCVLFSRFQLYNAACVVHGDGWVSISDWVSKSFHVDRLAGYLGTGTGEAAAD